MLPAIRALRNAFRLLPPVLVLACVLLPSARAESTDSALPTPTLASQERQLEAWRAADAGDPQTARLVEIYTRNVQDLHTVDENREHKARYERLFQEAPAKIARYTAELNDLQRQTRSAQGLAEGVAMERLERLLRETRSRLAALRTEEGALQGTAANLQRRVEASRQELKAAVAAGAGGDSQPAAIPGENAAMTQARLDQWLVDRALHDSLVGRLDAEVRTVPDRLAAVQAELKLVTAQREQAETFLAELLGMDKLKRIGAAEKLRDDIHARAARPGSAHPAIVKLRGEVEALADEYVDVVARSESVAAEAAGAAARLAEVTGAYESIRQQLEIVALSDALGPVLMEQYDKLGGYSQPQREMQVTSELLSETRLREFQVTRMASSEVQARELVYRELEADTALSDADRAAALVEADRLLSDRSRLVGELARLYVESTGQIVDLEESYLAQTEVARKFRALLDRNLIWMKSHPPLRLRDLLAWPGATVAIIAAQDWRALGAQALAVAAGHPLRVLGGALLLAALLHYRQVLRRRLAERSLREVGWRHYRYRMGLEAFGIHLLVALPVPLLLAAAGWVFAQTQPGSALASALSGACWRTALLGYLYLVILEAMTPEGFARGHLRWKTARVRSVERLLRLGVWIMLPLAFASAALGAVARTMPADESYRIGSLLVAALFFAFLVLLARAARGMFDSAFYSRSYPLLARVGRLLLAGVIVAQPVAIVLDVQGYHFTARELLMCAFLSSVVLVVAKMMLDAGLLGLTIAAQRSLDATRAAETPAAGAGEGSPEQRSATEAFDEADLEKMNSSAIALLQVVVAGLATLLLAVIWQQFFTALSMLDTVTLWNYAETVDGKETVATVSAFDLGGALLVLGLGLVLASGLPSLIGIVFYSVITEKGVLYAIQTVIRYVIGVLAVMVSLQMLGFGWSKLQWMAAGLSVGVGFGLQAIFANFFSGLIMLFERPVRIGDVITLGEYSGTIQRIRMRATTLTDFDNREIIVPNQMFVTERLINWTLTDSVVRLSFDVGISYDADPRVARETILELMRADQRILSEPPPNVVFVEFGASSLNLRCYAHVKDISVRMQVQNDLHMRINEVFRERGIEIAYPQMDLHVRTMDGVPTFRA